MTQHAELAQDELTGLLNRSAALQAVHDFMQAATSDHPLSVALLDVDRFAAFDYEHGLEVGDALLASVSDGAGHSYVGGENGALYRFDGNQAQAMRTGPTDDITAVTVAPEPAGRGLFFDRGLHRRPVVPEEAAGVRGWRHPTRWARRGLRGVRSGDLPRERRRYALPDAADGSAVNHPAEIAAVYAGLAEIRGQPVEHLAAILERNFVRLFGS